MPIRMSAIPEEGYRFVSWSDPELPKTPDIELYLSNDKNITAIFEKVGPNE